MYNPGKTMLDNYMGTKTKDIVYTQVINGQTVVTRKTVPWNYDVTGKDFLTSNPTSETIGSAVDMVENLNDIILNAIKFVKDNWQICILGGLALIIFIKRL